MSQKKFRPSRSIAHCSDSSQEGRSRHSLDYSLFILLNAILFLRPADVFPALNNVPIYNVAILVCLSASLGKIIRLLPAHSLVQRPICVCVVGLLPAVILSHLSHGYVGGALSSLNEFSKLVIYYLLLESVLDSPSRLDGFLKWICLFITTMAVLALMQFYGWTDLAAFAPHVEWGTNPESGEDQLVTRLSGAGIFGNPNDISRILLFGMAICLYQINGRRGGLLHFLWIAPLWLFGLALVLTQSRGAFLALLAGMLAFFASRYGRKALMPVLLSLPVVLMLFAGRQTDISVESGTGQERIKLWSEGFQLLLRSPLFGIGMNEYVEVVKKAAHNSFIQCYTELGLFGGSLFFGANLCALLGLINLSSSATGKPESDLLRLRPYLLGILVLYQVGMLTSNRSYSLPSYLMLGLAAVYVRVNNGHVGRKALRFSLNLLLKIGVLGLVFLLVVNIFVRINASFG